MTPARRKTRERRSLRWIERIQQDVRYALRSLRRTPGFTIAVILTLGLGIGANAAMFGVVDRLMFRPFPYLREPAAVHRVYLQFTSRGRVLTQSVFPYTRYADLRRWTTSFSEYAAETEWRLAVGSDDASRERAVAGVSASFFHFFTARPVLGRFFSAEEDVVPRGANVAVVSYGYWKTGLGGRNVIGESLQVGPLLTTIVGVAPEGFVGIGEREPPVVFMPITAMAYGVTQGDAQSFARTYKWDWASAIVRRKPGITADAASADLTNAYVRSRDAQRAMMPSVAPTNVARPRAIAGALKTVDGPGAGLESLTLLWVSGVALIVLLIACANVANLMVARVLRRQREIAVRLALGVSGARLAAQFLTESLIVALLGCVAGVAFGQSISVALGRLLLHDGAPLELCSDRRTLTVAATLALASGALVAIGPALLAGRADLAGALRPGARGVSIQRSRIHSALLVAQAALSVVLLVGAGLFVKSLNNVRSMGLGWNPAPVLIVTPNYRGLVLDSNAMTTLRQRLIDAAQSLPEVAAAARVNSLPFATSTSELHVPGIDSVQRLGRFNCQPTTPSYFDVIGTRIVRGRAFTSADRGAAALVAVVSESMARALWPGQEPLGKCLRIGTENAPCSIVIGVAEDAVQYTITDSERFLYYIPDEHPEPIRPGNRLLVRVRDGDTAAHRESVRRALQAVLPPPAYVTVSSLEDLVDIQRRSWRLGATMFVAFGALALVVAAIGLYGVIAYNVAQRMHELGVRIALGAQSRNIVAMVLRQGFTFAGAGVFLGVLAALLASRWVQPLLFQESAKDPFIFLIVSAMIGLIALLASAAPALRATRADPNTALRAD